MIKDDLEHIRKKKEQLGHTSFIMALQLIFVFGLPAVAALLLGKWLNDSTSIAPYGTLLTGGLAFALSWAIVIRMYQRLTRSFKELQEQEQDILSSPEELALDKEHSEDHRP
ncbi:MAG: hypothetical protein COU35_02940 [Candidatus Magasanikbacteria bacterium CG10_big_fil_rev_8_21_14_0_10_47_10]|uniref:Uncharacterized protein n=1 Tax=Candidatus Magasanikbacteria bacterium CG10_big_fil_rev_8_21_14_0_10_47_10 TaxID=1974652 RepID=A0A2H0TQD9_9BACT|nr:MAG: hypothetical protein COU35_02940 [Candidatus Magasanikbacteria bacterium CG10_big_fil_rev_8_21_14_0_10_47_10]